MENLGLELEELPGCPRDRRRELSAMPCETLSLTGSRFEPSRYVPGNGAGWAYSAANLPCAGRVEDRLAHNISKKS